MIDIPTTITTATPKQAPPANSLLIPATAWFGTQRGVAQPVPLTQYDDTLPVLAVALYLNGQPYTVPEGAAVNVRMDKRDGHYIYNPAYGLSDDRKIVYVAVTLQMTTGAGEYWPILELVVDGDVAGTSVLPLCIAKNPVPEGAVESTDEWKTIQQIAADVEEAAQAVQDNAANAAASATLSESWAVGGTGTREGENTNNAKYWAEQAQQIAQGAMGWYADPQALQSAHPTGHNGLWAIVGTTDTIWIWDSDTSAWVDSGSNMDLSQYYTKTEADARFLGAGDETVVRFVEISIDEETGAVTFTDPQFDFAFLAGCIRKDGETCVVRVKGVAATYSPNEWSEAEDGAVTLSFRDHGYIGDSSGKRVYRAPTLEITQRGGAVTGRRVTYIYNTLPNVDASDAGKALVVRADGSGYELGKVQTDAYTKAESDARYAPIEAAIRPTVSGNPATLEHSVAWVMQGLNVYGKSTQQTTTGAQLFDIKKATPYGSAYGLTVSIDGEEIKISGTVSEVPDDGSQLSFRIVDYPENLYGNKFSADVVDDTGVQNFVVYTDKNENRIKIKIGKIPIGTEVNLVFRLMVNSGLTALPWEPYTGGKPSPSPDYPQEIVTAGSDGSIDITVSDGANQSQQLSIQTPNGLPGIPISSGGNYVDENGQEWICDEVDFSRGVYVQRIQKILGYSDENVLSPYMSTTGQLTTGAMVIYVLAAPIETPLSPEELAAYAALRTYDGTTVVATDAPVAGLSARYVADGAAYIGSEIQAAVTEAVTQAVALTGGNA